jgi:hypothetical protein
MKIKTDLAALCLMLGLSGCYMSDAPLLDDTDAIHALPIAAKLVRLDDQGLVFKDDGKLDEAYLVWNGQAYVDPTQQESPSISIHTIAGPSNTYLVQQVAPSTTLYFLATLADNGTRAALRGVEQAGEGPLAAKLQELGAVSQGFDAKGPAYKVTDRDQLLSAAAFEASLPGKDAYRYLLVRYISIPPAKEGLPEAHNAQDASGFSPVYWYAQGMAAEHGIANAPIDLTKATADYRKAAEAGIAGAMADFGRMLESGVGVPADTSQAVDWYKKAVTLGNSDAMLLLGKAVLSGIGSDKDVDRGGYLLRMAAASGNIDAMKLLADMLDKGDLIAADREERLFWLLKAAEAGDDAAVEKVESAIRSGDGTAPNPQQADRWLEKARQQAIGSFPVTDTAVSGKEYQNLSPEEHRYYMTGFLDMLWSIGDRLNPQGLNGDCAEGYAMDNASDAANGLTSALADFAQAQPQGNLSEVAANYVYAHCDTRRNLLLLDFYVLNFSGVRVLSDTAFNSFLRGALGAAVQAHLAASKRQIAACIEHTYSDDAAYADLLDKLVGYDDDLVTNIMMQKLDVLCP